LPEQQGRKTQISLSATFGGYSTAPGPFTGWFGPQAPMVPTAPPEVAGRRMDYQSGINLLQRPRPYEPVSFDDLRALADSWDILRLLVETRKDQLSRLTWGFHPRLSAASKPMCLASDPRIMELTEFFESPDKEVDWDEWVRQLLEDLLVIDAPTLYNRRTRGGAIYGFEPIDGATIKRVITTDGRTPAPPLPAYQQVLKGMPAVDYTTDDIIYRPRNVRTHKVYGYSPVEQIIVTVNIALRRVTSVGQYFTEGNVPDSFIGVPETWNPDHIASFQKYWDALLEGDTGARRKAKFVPGGMKYIPTKDPDLKAMFDEWLARIACFAFSVNPQPFINQINRATATVASTSAKEEGLAPMKHWLTKLINFIVRTRFGYRDIEFSFLTQEDMDPKVQADIRIAYAKSGLLSINRVREGMGEPPKPGLDDLMVLTAQGYIPVGKFVGTMPLVPVDEEYVEPAEGDGADAGAGANAGADPADGVGAGGDASGGATADDGEDE